MTRKGLNGKERGRFSNQIENRTIFAIFFEPKEIFISWWYRLTDGRILYIDGLSLYWKSSSENVCSRSRNAFYKRDSVKNGGTSKKVWQSVTTYNRKSLKVKSIVTTSEDAVAPYKANEVFARHLGLCYGQTWWPSRWASLWELCLK